MHKHNYMAVAMIEQSLVRGKIWQKLSLAWFYCLFFDQYSKFVLKNEFIVSVSQRGIAPEINKSSLELVAALQQG